MNLALGQNIHATIQNDGYLFLPEYKTELDAPAIAFEIGTPLVPWSDRLVQKLVPQSSSTPNTYSGIYGLGRFPLHSDLAHWRTPPRYLLLRCVRGYADVPTPLFDSSTLTEALGTPVLKRAIVRPRRPIDGRFPYFRLYEDRQEDGCVFRWDETFLRPASKVAISIWPKLQGLLSSIRVTDLFLRNAGDTLVIDNWRMLHSRSPIPAGREDRRIDRVYLEELK